MRQFFIQSNQVSQDIIRMEGKDVNHIRNVLRMGAGEQLAATDENGMEYLCEIENVDAEGIDLKILDKFMAERELSAEVYLFQGLPKGDKMELIIEKAVELGVHKVVPVETKRCIVKLDEKKAAAKIKRWSAIAESAAKQSKRCRIPQIHSVITLKEALAMTKDFQLVCIPYEEAKGMDSLKHFLSNIKPGMKIGFFIGPEGGFEADEIQQAIEHGVEPVSLGKRILRTETAGLTLMSMIMLNLECIS